MTVTVNGTEREVADGTTLGQLVDGEVADRRGIAAAVDGHVVARSVWDDAVLSDGARVELVGAVQGG